jgi:hypothetical protein
MPIADPPPRLFPDDAAIRRIGEGLLACTLPKADWTHEAHIAATCWLLRDRPDVDVDAAIGGFIRRYNAAVGGVNDDTSGYHATITQSFVAGIRSYLSLAAPEASLAATVNSLLLRAEGQRNWPLGFYSHERLFSVAARRDFVAPDLAPLPGA